MDGWSLGRPEEIEKAVFTHTGFLPGPATATTPAPACGFSHTPAMSEPLESLFFQ